MRPFPSLAARFSFILDILKWLLKRGVGMNLPVSRWPSVTTKGEQTRYYVQGRLDLNVYVLNCLQYVDVMLVPHVLSCASHAASEVAYKRGRAKFRVKAQRFFFLW